MNENSYTNLGGNPFRSLLRPQNPVAHQKTCPACGRTLVNLYRCDGVWKCKRCWDAEGEEDEMKAYIAGKITGDPTYKLKFRAAENRLYADGYDVVISPAVLPEGMSSADYMRICFAMMDSADVVAFLPDYAESRGAMVEHAYCQYASKQTFYLAHQENTNEHTER